MTPLSLKTLIIEKNARVFKKILKMPPLPSWLQDMHSFSSLSREKNKNK
jgi:hypothetical protein